MKLTKNRRAFALVLVLIALVLASSMAVFFLTSVARERLGVSLYATGSEVHHLAGMPVSQIIGQINAATKEGTLADPVSWASQPGMIRTFSADGNLKSIYKLYSWDNTVEHTTTFDPSASNETPPGNWLDNPATYVDINEPINDVYPIVDPAAEDDLVEGFSIDTSAAAVVGSGLDAPMPVKWLYVLEDGQLVPPTGGSGSTVDITGATEDNPIIGRIAYWTDDETCKVNINTASEGAFWDWPKAATFNEMQFAGNPPVGGEFNRIPGHPAMTSLSAVFPEPVLAPGDRWTNMASYRQKLAALLKMTPRIPYSDSSSRGGTYPIEVEKFVYGPATGVTLPAVPNKSMDLKSDRLYVSADEWIFDPVRSVQPNVTPDMVRRRAFFLTSQSRAPETTLFETPRISLWPVTWSWPSAHASLPNRQTAAVTSPNPDTALLSSNEWMRAEEKLLAFTATLGKQQADGGDRYYFQRQNPESPVHDYDNIARNRNLIAYLQAYTEKAVPGYGGSLANKLTEAGRDAVLANSLNIVRSLVNQYTMDPKVTNGSMLYAFTPVSLGKFKNKLGNLVKPYNESGAFSPIPLKVDIGTGQMTTISEFPLLREAALVFYATERDLPVPPVGTLMAPPSPATQANNRSLANPWNWTNLINLDPTNGYPLGARTTKMRAFMALDFSPVRGSTRNNQPVFWVKLRGAAFSANGTSINFGSATAKMDFRAGTAEAFMLSMYTRDATGLITGIKTFNNGDVNDSNYGLISSPINVLPDKTTFSFSGSPLVVELYGIKNGNPATDPTNDSSLLIASYNVDFRSWDGSHPIPIAPYWNFIELVKNASAPAINPSPIFPNPNFKDGYKPVLPTLPETRVTSWAALEIAPPYRTGTATGDPAVSASPSSVWGFSALYGKTNANDGSLDTHLMGSLWGYPALYAFADSTGALMTDLTRRIRFSNTGAGAAPLAQNSNARNSGSLLTTARDDIFASGFPLITPYDSVLSVIVDPNAAGTGDGDPRLAVKAQFTSSKDLLTASGKLRQVLKDSEYPSQRPRQYHTLGSRRNTGYITGPAYALLANNLAPNGMATLGGVNKLSILGDPGNTTNDADAIGVSSAQLQANIPASKSVGDWSSSPGAVADGGVLTRPDQDYQSMTPEGSITGFSYQTPFFRLSSTWGGELGFDTQAATGFFSANRQIPSPITLLGGLPSSQTKGWQTLAFSPNPAAGASHPGLASPPDHLFLDLFWMPVAEPYPISEELSTAGKINLNYRIAPFGYIKRRTGLHALMKSTWITAMSNNLVQYYKSHYAMGDSLSTGSSHAVPNASTPGTLPNRQTRHKINVTETLDGFDRDVFDLGDIFRSASQLCEMWLVPEGSNKDTVKSTFWNDKLLTSDTAREQPYDHLYSRVTTKSNTYTVHWRVQSLRKAQGTDPGKWDEARDRRVSELRGSSLIERYLDPNATNIPDYADPTVMAAATTQNLAHYYKWRTVAENYFQP